MAEPTLDQLDPNAVLQAESFLVAWLQESYPALDLSEGRVLRDVIIKKAAVLHALEATDLDKLRQSMSMVAISANPDLADPALVDAVLSNFNIVRDDGAEASGQVVIVIDNDLTTPVPVNTIFTSGGLTYTTGRSFVGVTTAEAVLDPSIHRLITPRTDGEFGFVIDVVATAPGEIYKLRRNTVFPVDEITPKPAGILQAYAAQDFTSGRNAQTNADLVAEFKEALSPKVFSGRTHIDSLLLSLLPDLKATSIVGFGDMEMLRDRHNIFAGSQGGKADIYARTQSFPQTIALTKSATLTNPATNELQISIERDDAPGFYAVEAVLPVGSTRDEDSLQIVSDLRALDLTGTNVFVPQVKTMIEGAYSRYQTGILRFIDPSYDANKPVQYQAYVKYMPGIDTLQDKANDRAVRNPSADYLVRAPIPAFCTVSLVVQYVGDMPDMDAVKRAVADAINGLNFTMGRLPASIIHDAIHKVIGHQGVLVVSPLDIICQIHKPGGDVTELRSENMITLPTLPAEAVTSRTTVFFASPEDIDAVAVPVLTLPV